MLVNDLKYHVSPVISRLDTSCSDSSGQECQLFNFSSLYLILFECEAVIASVFLCMVLNAPIGGKRSGFFLIRNIMDINIFYLLIF